MIHMNMHEMNSVCGWRFSNTPGEAALDDGRGNGGNATPITEASTRLVQPFTKGSPIMATR
jgi:hypothetical protein